jgi:hypothetical protein
MQDQPPAPSAVDPDEDKRFDADRVELDKNRLDAISKYDKYMITLSSGALGLSILYMEKVAHDPRPETFTLLELSWFLFACTLVAMILSFLLSQFSWKRALEIHDLRHCERKNWTPRRELAKRYAKEGWEINPLDKYIEYINIGSLFAFTAGVISFILFACANLPVNTEGTAMAKTVTRGVKPDDGEKRGAPSTPPRPSPPKEQSAPKSEPAKSEPKKK